MTVKQQQCLLAYLGYAVGAIDGSYGKNTKAAIMAFQAAEDLVADGVCGKVTEDALLDAVANGRFAGVKTANIPQTGTFWDTIRHFTREEFKCKCGGRFCKGYPAEMQEDVVRIADDAREHFGKPAHVISGLRCPEWNAHEKGVWNSQHQYGEAIDLYIEGVTADELRRFVSSRPNHRYSYNINSTNVHFDIPARGR